MKETQKKPKEKQLLDRDTVSRSNVLIESKSVHHYLKESFLILQSQKHM